MKRKLRLRNELNFLSCRVVLSVVCFFLSIEEAEYTTAL